MLALPFSAVGGDEDKEFLTTLYELYGAAVLNAAYQILNDRQSAEDVLQDTFLKMIPLTGRLRGLDRDARKGYLIQTVRDKGAEVFIGHRAENVRGAALVCYSAAIHPDNPERAEADRLGIPSLEPYYLPSPEEQAAQNLTNGANEFQQTVNRLLDIIDRRDERIRELESENKRLTELLQQSK